MTGRDDDAAFERCAQLLDQADGLLIAAGAGIGVDSGLPDFRGTEGFWRAYPALGRARLAFEAIANPAAFRTDARLAWGFYGHRLRLYRETVPHDGFAILAAIAKGFRPGAFVFTSNVDGQFQKAGFDGARVCEYHGSIEHLQCTRPCSGAVWSADGYRPAVDDAMCRETGALPTCPSCGALARPNILMFGDAEWIETRTREQLLRLGAWRARVERLVVIEIGAGTAIPSVRRFAEAQDSPLIRINPLDARAAADRDVSLRLPALAALRGIDAALRRSASGGRSPRDDEAGAVR